MELLAEPPAEPTCHSGEDVYTEYRLTVRDDNCYSQLACEFLDSEKLSRLDTPTISLSPRSCAIFLHREGVSPRGVMTS